MTTTTVEIYADSDEFVRTAVSSELDDVRLGTIDFGVNNTDTPPETWAAAEWESNVSRIEEVDGVWVECYVAKCLSSDLSLTAGTLFLFTKVTLGDQSIIKLAGKLKVKS